METTSSIKGKTVDAYFSTLPGPAKAKLQELRIAIKKIVPKAEEVISYSLPSFKLFGMLVWYGGWKEHIGFYPGPKAIEVFKKELSPYQCSKGSIQFPMDKPLPIALINKIVKYRVKENIVNAELKAHVKAVKKKKN
ncbi:iron chaperone [Flavitalea flava]